MSSKHKQRSSRTFSKAEIRYMKSDARLMKRLQKPYKRKGRSIFSRLRDLFIG